MGTPEAREVRQIEYRYAVRRADLKQNPEVLFVFGDNMKGLGYGGQAKEMRGEPNAVGIPTKWKPSTEADAYFTDDDFPLVQPRIDAAFIRVKNHLTRGGRVVLPAAGVGSGRAELHQRAPFILSYIQRWMALL